MKKYTWLVFSNCDPDHVAEYQDWYDRTHIADLLRVPGVKAAWRQDLSSAQTDMTEEGIVVVDVSQIKAPFQNLAVYQIEADDGKTVLEEIVRRANTPDMEISPYIGEVYTVLYESK